MKKLVYATNSDNTIHFTDLFNDISAIVYVDDINEQEAVFGAGYYETDYSQYSDNDFLELTKEEAQEIDNLYAIYKINQLNPSLLSQKQKRDLAKMYRLDTDSKDRQGWKIYMDDTDVQKILDMMKKHDKVYGPFPRYDEPHKNFAEEHNLALRPSDYLHIVHSLTLEECRIETPYKTFSFADKYPGHELIVFNVRKNFTLKNGDSIGNFKVYIKIDLSRTQGDDKNPIVLVSFHD